MRIPRVKDIRVPASAGLDLVDDDDERSCTNSSRSRSRNVGASAEIRLGVGVLQRSRERRYIPSTASTPSITDYENDYDVEEKEKQHHRKLHTMESFEMQNRPTGGRSVRSYRIHTPHPSITATTSPASPSSSQRQIYTTTSSTLADDFRSWGYWVEESYHPSTSSTPSSSSSASSLPPYSEAAYLHHIHPASRAQYTADPEAYMQQDQQRRIELLDLWGAEWLGRNFPASSYPSLAAAENRAASVGGVKRKASGSGYGVLGAGNFTQGVRGVGVGEQTAGVGVRGREGLGMGQGQQQRGSGVWSWCVGALMGSNGSGRRAAEGVGEGAREVRMGGGMEGVQRRTVWRFEEDLPRYSRGEEPPAYEEF